MKIWQYKTYLDFQEKAIKEQVTLSFIINMQKSLLKDGQMILKHKGYSTINE